MLDASCFICHRHIFNAEDLVEHFQDWHSEEFDDTHILILAGMCIEGLKEAVQEKMDNTDDGDGSDFDLGSSIDVFDSLSTAKKVFDGFSGGKFSGGGAKSDW
jgi:hypothetical protein